MKNFLWIGVLVLVGCTHASVQVNSSGGTTTTTTSVSAGVSGRASPAAWALIGIGLIAAEAASPTRPSEPRATSFADTPPGRDGPRRVIEVDCTKPIEDWSANLKCK